MNLPVRCAVGLGLLSTLLGGMLIGATGDRSPEAAERQQAPAVTVTVPVHVGDVITPAPAPAKPARIVTAPKAAPKATKPAPVAQRPASPAPKATAAPAPAPKPTAAPAPAPCGRACDDSYQELHCENRHGTQADGTWGLVQPLQRNGKTFDTGAVANDRGWSCFSN